MTMCPEYLGRVFYEKFPKTIIQAQFYKLCFRDDMISDGIENCVQYMSNFDPEKSKNPFEIFYSNYLLASIRRIQKKKTTIC